MTFDAKQSATHQRRLGANGRRFMGVMTVHAFGMARHPNAGFRKGIGSGIGVFGGVMRRRRNQDRMSVRLPKELRLDVEVGNRAVMALKADILLRLLDEPL